MQKDDCIFCKLASHEIPTNVVYEDDTVMAFKDTEPLMPVHVLIIPKQHYDSIADDVPGDVLAHVFGIIPKVAKICGIRESGFRLLINTGEDASQSVKHFHVHMLGGGLMPRPNDQDWGRASEAAKKARAEREANEEK